MSLWTPPTIVVTEEAQSTPSKSREDNNWQLHRNGDRLSLIRPDGVTLCPDFTTGKARHRVNEAGQGAQLLAKALGIHVYRKKQGHLPAVLDATGGLGQDAWAIASLGCTVLVMERHPVIHALLANALDRARADESSRGIASRITLQNIDASNWFTQNKQAARSENSAQIIYLDPMYPARKQKADSKKGMQFLHALLGPPATPESPQLLQNALTYQAARVVVKRPKGAESLAGSAEWTGQITSVQSANTRYDIYHQSRKF